MHSEKSYRPDIDGLRALAVLAVVGFHAFPNSVKGGFVGVDIFFVISGFLITGILQKDLQTKATGEKHGFWLYISTFYQRRVARIFPALLGVLVACFALGWLFLQPAEFKTLGKHMLAGAGFASNLVFWQEAGYFDAAAETKTLLHLWSLAVEEQFYLIWPLLLWAVYKFRFRTVWVICGLFVASFAWNVLQIHSQPVATFYSPFTRFWELLAGALLAVLSVNTSDSRASVRLQNGKSIIGLLLIAAAIYLLTKDKRFPGWWAVLPVLGSYLIISAGSIKGSESWFNRVVLSNRMMVSIGLISYPLYLWHWPLLAFLRGMQMDTPSTGMLWAVVATSFALAYLTYWLIERPLRFGTWWQGKTRLKTGLLLLAMVATAAASYAVYAKNGISSRFPPQLRGLLDYEYDYGESNGHCMVGIGGNQSQLSPYCYTKNPAFKKSVALWGDSYTWHLAAALSKRGKLDTIANSIGFNLIASAGCTPVLNADADYCQQGNAFVFETLQKQPFETIVLAGNWTHEFQAELDATLQKLQAMQSTKQLAAKDIYLVGPPPGWRHSLYKAAVNAALKDPQHQIPTRLKTDQATNMQTGLIADFALDAKMRATAQRHGFHYISLLDKLCNADGCLVKLGDTPDALVGYDQGHLSLLGAEFVVKQFPNQLFE
jgi:peptidoglycan/LPS O-acetylase OafA/YrhL